MLILSLNIKQGGGSRLDKIISYIKKINPDICILCEYRQNKNTLYLHDELGQLGLVYKSSESVGENINQVFIASKVEFETEDIKGLDEAYKKNILIAHFPKFLIYALYFPQKNQKKNLYRYLINKKTNNIPHLMMGDFNTGMHYIDEEQATFYCEDLFRNLLDGWTDLWRSRNKIKEEYSWYSNQKRGFRIDHALGNEILNGLVSDIYYDHSTRNTISDHSALIVKLKKI